MLNAMVWLVFVPLQHYLITPQIIITLAITCSNRTISRLQSYGIYKGSLFEGICSNNRPNQLKVVVYIHKVAQYQVLSILNFSDNCGKILKLGIDRYRYHQEKICQLLMSSDVQQIQNKQALIYNYIPSFPLIIFLHIDQSLQVCRLNMNQMRSNENQISIKTNKQIRLKFKNNSSTAQLTKSEFQKINQFLRRELLVQLLTRPIGRGALIDKWKQQEIYQMLLYLKISRAEKCLDQTFTYAKKKIQRLASKVQNRWITSNILLVSFLALLLFPSSIPRSEFLFISRSSIFIILFGDYTNTTILWKYFRGKRQQKKSKLTKKYPFKILIFLFQSNIYKPLNRSKIIMNSQKISRFEKAFDQQQCQQFIKDALDQMGNSGYDFKYSSKPLIGKCKQMRRNGIYLRFKCLKCFEKKKEKRFTSTMGTVSIWFQFQELNQKRRDPWLLIFRFQIYRMQCQTCGEYGQPEIYDSQLEKIQKQFCKIVAEILNKIPPKKKKRNTNPIKVPDLHNHKHKECQACKLKKCHQGKCPT